ncbi:MAG: glycosyltransferase [bacterium]|nr:glycosyltransferase [bacterium]
MSISLCMIARNEESCLEKCLNSVKDIVDEIIVVDSKSTDKTLEIAKKFNAKTFDFEWQDDFSAARNFSLSKATKDWILILDADEIIAERDLNKIKKLTESKDIQAFLLIQLNYSNEKGLGFIELQNKTPESFDFAGCYPSPIVRLFRNNKGIKFDGKVHETVDESLQDKKVALSTLPIHHYQELKGKETFREKQLNYLDLLEKDAALNPSADRLHKIGIIHYRFNKNYEKAIENFEKAIKLNSNDPSIFIDLGSALAQQKKYDEAIVNFKKSVEIKPTASAFYNLGLIYATQKQFGLAVDAYNNAIKLGHPDKEELLKQIEALEQSRNSIKFSASVG